jgi:hypothetical protein
MTFRSGSEYICDLPDWCDGRENLCSFKGQMYLSHPEHPPHVFDEKQQKWMPIK